LLARSRSIRGGKNRGGYGNGPWLWARVSNRGSAARRAGLAGGTGAALYRKTVAGLDKGVTAARHPVGRSELPGTS